ncbi:hypothetical protein SAMN05216238_106191 [Lentibacillus persicus]|uniref:PDZ domain-containing protein n=1 Tax=Lentibacillus persicus TaxID=640948 RepID=A0A1I1WNC4_9BACI|nr:PDZ domain-containing protein [Lentibacillus persicus]SFD96626.1 hypothetical protein SAMN05216238_106191 [Lentibacillus persicus]
MVQSWLMELLNGIGRFFLNPLLYWAIILSILVGYKRIKSERQQFGLKIFDVFSECKKTWLISLSFGLIVSLLAIGVGFVFSYHIILLISGVTILLSLSLRLTLLSPVYTIGLTFFILLFSPFVLNYQSIIDPDLFETPNFTALSILTAVLLSAEAFLLKRQGRNDTFPEMKISRRGTLIGMQHLRKMTLIPFFVLVPSGSITAFASYWPYFSIGGETFSLVLIPFLIGFDHLVQGSLSEKAAGRLAGSLHILSLIILLMAAGSIYIGWLSLAAAAVGILGREYLSYRHRIKDQENPPFFNQTGQGVKVLAVIPASPADRLGIAAGETISKVNGKKIADMEQFYYALQKGGAFFKMEVIGDNGEARFLQSALYEEDHHELGVITTFNRHQKNNYA